MSGIFGIYSKKIHPNKLEKIAVYGVNSIGHRGPDAIGVVALHKNALWFAHSRLSILELSDLGAQPMKFRELAITFNGEIYNYKDIRSDLETRGYIFSSNSDTEVLIKAWYEWGAESLKLLRGMYAFAIYDERSQDLFLVRDQIGIKPMYFIKNVDFIAFSSEIKGFGGIPQFNFEVDREALPEYLSYKFVMAPNTILKNVKVVRPGCYLKINLQSGSVMERQYWDFQESTEYMEMEEGEAIESFNFLFSESIREHSISDVEVGILQSGGIDSTLIAKYFFQIVDPKSARAYMVDFSEGAISERQYVDRVIKMYGHKLDAYIFSNNEYDEALSDTTYHLDEPINHPHTPYFQLLFRRIKEQLSVVLSGEGADEVFAGYQRYAGITNTEGVLNSSRFLSASSIAQALSLTVEDVFERSNHGRLDLIKKYDDHGSLLRLQQKVDIKTSLTSLLNRIDKTSMASGVEVRVPFLDIRLVELGLSLPDHIKIKDGCITKNFLKKVIASEFGDDFAYRRKVGFHTPYHAILKRMNTFSIYDLDALSELGISADWVNQGLHKLSNDQLDYEVSDLTWTTYSLVSYIKSLERKL